MKKGKRFFKIPFCDKYLILGDGYCTTSIGKYDDFKGYLKALGRQYCEGLWTENMDSLIEDIMSEYHSYHKNEKGK